MNTAVKNTVLTRSQRGSAAQGPGPIDRFLDEVVVDPATSIECWARPDFGDAVEVRAGEIPVFWACGVTPQCALMAAKLPLAITHAPGCMFVTDGRDESLAVG